MPISTIMYAICVILGALCCCAIVGLAVEAVIGLERINFNNRTATLVVKVVLILALIFVCGPLCVWICKTAGTIAGHAKLYFSAM